VFLDEHRRRILLLVAVDEFPLSETDAAELAHALGDRSLDSVLGMLAAVVSVPEVLPSQVWLGELMGNAKFHRVEDAQRFADQIMRLNNFVARSLMNRMPELVCPDPGDDRACREFCDAYVHMVRRVDADPEDESEVGHGLGMLAGYALLSDAALEEDLGSKKKVATFKKGVRDAIPEIVGSLHVAWLEQRKVAMPVMRRDGAKVGRNDLCPCGSGKKYKKCHGAQA